jgi:putative iron-regulated protein
VLAAYAELAFATYSDSVSGARALALAAGELVAAPSAEHLAAARNAWRAARVPYAESEVFRFYDGPIDRVEASINAWPIDESYVEAGLAGKRPGIIDNQAEYPTLSASLLVSLNSKEGETSVSTGFHVLELLLWGRDTHADGPGDRPHTDYLVGTPLASRRGQYLKLASAELVRELEGVRDAWAPERTDNYRADFLRLPPLQALARIVKGMGSLSGPELEGERLTVPYATKDQENEQSCFSDSTDVDIVHDALGVQNVCLGRYQRSDGSQLRANGLCALIAAQSPSLARELEQRLAESVAAARSIPAPFDQAILGNDAAPGRRAIENTMTALRRQVETLTRIAAELSLKPSSAPRRSRP